MSPHTEPPSTAIGTTSSASLTPAEIVTAIIPALIGLAGVAFIAMLMLL